MKILFLSLSHVDDLNKRGIYTDLLREFVKNDNDVYVVSPIERRYKVKTHVEKQGRAFILNVRTLNIQKTNFIEKGIGTVLLESQFLCAIKKYYKNIKFDLVLYATPPITLVNPIKFVKKRDNAKTYLMLKDIFPQNAVDIGILSKSGVKGLIYNYFRKKEKMLYAISDRIGCMSQANVDYVLKNNPEINPDIVEICPNSIEVQNMRLDEHEKLVMRHKYDLPTDKKVFVYGGNLGKPQGISFIIECLRAEKDNKKAFFLIVGDGTEFGKIEAFVNEEKPTNVKLMKSLPKEDYDRMIAACDIGMIFLDHRFTIPNFPSRLLSYMQAGLPVLACTDPNTDICKVITEGGFGWWCESDDASKAVYEIAKVIVADLADYGYKSKKYLKENYSIYSTYETISAFIAKV